MATTYLQRMFLGAVLVFAFSSCYYYKTTTLNGVDPKEKRATLDSVQAANRYLILRNGTAEAYHIMSLHRGEDSSSIMLSLDTVSKEHRFRLQQEAGSKPRYRRSNPAQNKVVSEVHVYTPYVQGAAAGPFVLPLDSIEKIEIVKHDAKRTTNSHVLSGLGIVAVGLGIGILITFLTIPFD